MKKYAYLTLVLVLTASMLVGCGCSKQKPEETSVPTVLPTNEEVWDNTQTTTQPSIVPDMTLSPTETYDRGNGPLEDTTGSTASTDSTGTDSTGTASATDPTGASGARSRSVLPGSSR